MEECCETASPDSARSLDYDRVDAFGNDEVRIGTGLPDSASDVDSSRMRVDTDVINASEGRDARARETTTTLEGLLAVSATARKIECFFGVKWCGIEERCQQGKTQNSHESLQSVIWSLVLKEQHVSLFAVQAAVAEAVLFFNTGNVNAFAAILGQLDITIFNSTFLRAREKDCRESATSNKLRKAFQSLRKLVKKKRKDGMHPDYAPGVF
ncbi:hypothetical protein HPB51_017876 [Rhipicephalus microplus]|uniref:Uncharacterized protein n=1 Tax=Rhipicephalus microplus TaxID=6941 RepID=A0A9J6DAN0_RHIMP|nr:hypothetical protein HPB51_017876 [Rhipicephalus microplus]